MSAAQPNLMPKGAAHRSGRHLDDDHLVAMQCHWQPYRTSSPMAKLAAVRCLSSTAGVFGVIGRLTEAGYLQRVDRRIARTRRFFERPVLGHVCAGLPRLAHQACIEVLTLDDYLVDDPARTSLHRVCGNTISDAGIPVGDRAVVEHPAPTQVGDIVLAVVDGELTVKTLALDANKRSYFKTANAALEATHTTSSLELMGVVVGVVRRVRR